MKRFFSIALVFVLLLAAGCSPKRAYGSDSVNSAEMPATAPVPQAYDELGLSVKGEAEYVKNTTAGGEAPDYGGHKIIRTFSVSFETGTFDSDVAAIIQSVAELGGYVENSNVNGRKPEVYSDPGRYAYLTLRVPAEKVDGFVQNVKGYGSLLSANENAQDVTESYFDLDTRLEVLRAQLDRLKSILVTTDNLADIIALETEISNVTLQIEQLTTELRRYDGLISYATVNVTIEELRLNEGPAAQTSVGERIERGFTDTLYGVGTFFVNLFVFLVSALPALVVLGVIAVIVLLIIRAAKKRKAKKPIQPLFNKEGNPDEKR